MILVPAMVVLQMGMTSCSSASKILRAHATLARNGAVQRWKDEPVEVLAGADGRQGVRVGERREDADPRGEVRSARARGAEGGVVGGVGGTYSLEFSNCARTAMIASLAACGNKGYL
jgi:hypothetical protein